MVSDYRKSKELGMKAFTKGIGLAPALDKEMMELIKGKTHKESTRYLRAYHKGWLGERLK